MKKIISLLCAVVLSFLLANGITFLFERPVGYIYTPNGASRAIRRPGSFLIHNTEGHHFSEIDKNGFINADMPLSGSYVLVPSSRGDRPCVQLRVYSPVGGIPTK